MVSAHWEERPTTLGATRPVPLVYDFYGFPEKYYQTKYASPGAPELAARVRELLRRRHRVRRRSEARSRPRGLRPAGGDVSPCRRARAPDVDTGLVPEELVGLGRALAPLRDEGVLIFGSGFLTHNMRYAFQPALPAWARSSTLGPRTRCRVSTSTRSRTSRRAPRPPRRRCRRGSTTRRSSWRPAPRPTSGRTTTFPITGWWMDGAFTKRSVQFG